MEEDITTEFGQSFIDERAREVNFWRDMNGSEIEWYKTESIDEKYEISISTRSTKFNS